MCKLVEAETNQGNKFMVADIKKDYILNIIKNAHLCSAIEEIVLFGSALEERCTVESDIDIAIFGKKHETPFLTSKSYQEFTKKVFQYGDFQDYDMLYFREDQRQKTGIYNSIRQGETIYKKRVM